jgi:hypothetical protein
MFFRDAARCLFSCEDWRGLSPRPDGPPMRPWPRGTCRGEGDAVLSVSKQPCGQMLAALRLGDLVAIRDAVAKDADFRRPVPETNRRGYHRSNCGTAVWRLPHFQKAS